MISKTKMRESLFKNQRMLQLKKQRTVPQEILQLASSEKVTIKNLIQNVKMKQKAHRWVIALSPSRRFKNLRRNQYLQINDKSHFIEEDELIDEEGKEADKVDEDENEENQDDERQIKSQVFLSHHKQKKFQKVFHYLRTEFQKILFKLPIIGPNSLFKLIWDALQSLVILIMSVVLPIKLAVNDFPLCFYLGSNLSLALVIVLLIIDMIVCLNTAFFRRGQLQLNRIQILRNYIRQMGIYDIIAILSLFYEMQRFGFQFPHSCYEQNLFDKFNSFIQLFIFSYKAVKLSKYLLKIEEIFSFKRRTLNILALAKLLLFILKVSHIFACIWLFIGRSNPDSSSSWIIGMEQESWVAQYLKSYYFICVTMTTIGYGDIVPKNPVETIVCIFTMIIACVIFGYTINSIGSVFMELKKEDEEKKENMFIINNYFNEKSISRELQSSIREYLEYYWTQWSMDNSEKEHNIISQLSQEMKEQFLLQANKIVLKDCKFFQKNFSQEVIQKTVYLIKEKKLTPNEIIIGSGEDISNSGILYFVENGEVDILQEFQLNQDSQNSGNYDTQLLIQNHSSPTQQKKSWKRVTTVKKGKYFGELSFFTGFPNKFIAKSRGFSKILFIDRNKFIEFLKENLFNDDYETFCQIKDSLQSNEISSIHSQCCFCRATDHSLMNCPTIHLSPIKMLTICRHNFSSNIIERKEIVRRKINKQSRCTLLGISRVFLVAQRFQVKNESFIEQNFAYSECSQSDYGESQYSEDEDESDEGYDQQDDEIQDSIKYSNKIIPLKEIHSPQSMLSSVYDANASQEQSPENNVSIVISPKSIKVKQKRESVTFASLIQKQITSEKSFKDSPKNSSHGTNKKSEFSQRRQQSSRKNKKSSTISLNNDQHSLYKKRNSNFDKVLQPTSNTRAKAISFGGVGLVKQNSFSQKLILLKGDASLPQQQTQSKSYCFQQNSSPFSSTTSHHPRHSNIKSLKSLTSSQQQERRLGSFEAQQKNKQIQSQKKFNEHLNHEGIIEFVKYKIHNLDFRYEETFEIMKIFKNYYPQYNHDKVLQKIRKRRIQETSFKGNYIVSKWNAFKKKSDSSSSTHLLRESSLITTIREGIKKLTSPAQIASGFSTFSMKMVQENDKQSDDKESSVQKIVPIKSIQFTSGHSPKNKSINFRQKLFSSLKEEAFKDDDYNFKSVGESPIFFPTCGIHLESDSFEISRDESNGLELNKIEDKL